MINVSDEFRKLMNVRTDFNENAEITFADGTVLELTEKDFTVSNNNVTDASETSGIPLGVAVCRSIQIELMNDDDRFSEYDFFGATIRLYLTFQLSETVEKIEYGTFTVLTPETYGTTVIITALDDMYKADRDYSTNITYPASLQTILVDACNTLDISLGSTSFHNSDFVVNEKPTDITFRQMFGYIAMIAVGNARIDVDGHLRIISYDFSKLEEIKNGGIYSPWNNPNDLDGGSFSPWNLGDVADGGTFTDRNEYHSLSNWSNLKVDTDDVVITGVQTTYTGAENEEHTVMYGVEGYVLAVENPLIVGQEEYAVGLIGNVMVGGRFRQFSGDLISNPTIEFMDIAVITDRKGNVYASFITDINFQFFGFTTLKNSAETALRNSAKTYSDATKTLVKARELVKNERTAREQAVAQLAKDLKNSSGLFMTEDVQPDGSTIYYMHDKPTLAESMIVWKLTTLAFGISTDGGKTYTYGFTVDGTTITRLLYAEGINADYINTGALKVVNSENKIVMMVDVDTGEFYTAGTDNSNKEVFTKIYGGKFEIRGSEGLSFIMARLSSEGTAHMGLLSGNNALGLGFRDDSNDNNSIFYYLNNGLNPNGLTERHLFNGPARFLNAPRIAELYFMDSKTSTNESNWVHVYKADYDGLPSMAVDGGMYAYGSIGCSGQKYRVVDTEHYGKVGMNAFETAEAYFSDIGSGVIGKDETTEILFDSVFSETVDLSKPYQVQITQTSEKRTRWVEKKTDRFIVHGESGATFDWIVMCKQKDYSNIRMQKIILKEENKND